MRSIRLNVGATLPRGAHLEVIDELKGLAIALVILYHAGGVLDWPNYVHGEVGVDLFLLVSGFMLAATAADQPLRQFVARRFLRIFPSYWLALVVFLVAHRLCFGLHYPWGDVLAHFLGVHAYGRLPYFADISDAFWFISMVVGAYGVFMLVRRRLDDLSFLVGVCGALTTIAVLTYAHFSHYGGLISLAVRIPSFFCGLIAGRLLGHGTAEIRLNPSLGLGLACFYYLMFFRSTACNYTLPAIGLLLAWIGLRPLIGRLPLGRPFRRLVALLGVISYEVYLFHQPLIRDYNIYVLAHGFNIPDPSRLQKGLGIAVGLVVTVTIAALLHHFTVQTFRRFAGPGPAADPSQPLGNTILPLPLC